MMQILKLLALTGLAALVAAEDGVCHSTEKVTTLEEQLAASRAEVARLKAALETSQSADGISVTAMATEMGGILSNVLEEQLKKTDLDDQVYEKLQQSFGSVSEFTQNVMTKVKEVDYYSHFENLKVGEKYNTHLAPHVEKATKLAQPYMEQYVHPNLEKANVQLGPHVTAVKDACSKHYKTLETDVLPKLKKSASQVFDTVSGATATLGSPTEALDKALAPAFDAIAGAAPKQAKALPKKPVDRLLLVLVSIIALYFFLRIGWTTLKIALKTTRVGTRITLFLTKIGLLLPVRVVLRVLRLVLWFSTGFYCCGLCRRKKAAASNKAEEKPKEKVKKASLEEIVALLTEAQKKKKLDAAVKQMATLCKSEKALTTPKNLEGKIVTQDVLKGAFKKLGVDAKGLL